MAVRVEDRGRVRVLILDRPEARNALDGATRRELMDALADAEQNHQVGAVVLTGTGKSFAAGADLKELMARDSDEQRAFLQSPHIYSTIETLRMPVVAAINGFALGAGLELATACDVRVAATDAKMGQPEIRFALLPGGGGTQRLPRLVGLGHASRLILTGDIIGAEEAQAMGLVEHVAEDALAFAVDLASRMAQHESEALAVAKHALRASRQMPYDAGLEHEVEAFVTLHAREASRARIQAFLHSK